MVLLKFIIVSIIVSDITSIEIPISVRNRLENARTLEEFLSFSMMSDASRSLSADFHRGRSGIPNKCDLEDSCVLVPVCVPVEPDLDDSDSPYFPSCVKLIRCVESSHNHKKYCMPTTNLVEIKVVHYKYVGNRDGYCRVRRVHMQNHTACTHQERSKGTRRHTHPMVTTQRTDLCGGYDQCPGNVNDEEPKTRDHCTRFERFDPNCCSCVCQCTPTDGRCDCSADENENILNDNEDNGQNNNQRITQSSLFRPEDDEPEE